MVLFASLDHSISLGLGLFDAGGSSLFSLSLKFSITTLLKKDGLRATMKLDTHSLKRKNKRFNMVYKELKTYAGIIWHE